jgi:hypothetical protein
MMGLKHHLQCVHNLAVFEMAVIPAKAGIQCFRKILDAPVSGTGQAPQAGMTENGINKHILFNSEFLNSKIFSTLAKGFTNGRN